MATMIVRDHTIWAKHFQNGQHIVDRLLSLPQNAPIRLRIDGKPVLFRKMRDGVDGRPTPGIRPDESFRDYWNGLYRDRRGDAVEVVLDDMPQDDPYLAALSTLLVEWTSVEDAEAYDDL